MDTSAIDNLIQGRVEPFIYAFLTKTVPQYLKVGDTYRPVSVRLAEWNSRYKELEKEFEQVARVASHIYFRDYSVHEFLENVLKKHRATKTDLAPGVYFSNEFFRDTTPDDLRAAMKDIQDDFDKKTGKYLFYDTLTTLPVHVKHASEGYWKPRDNQKAVIKQFQRAVENGRRNLLMYAVMRFGKSFTALCCAKEISAHFIVIVSAKADVREEWRRNVECPENFRNDYDFMSSADIAKNYDLISSQLQDKNKKGIVLFLTLQDLQGEKIKPKHRQIFSRKVDLLIVDETHFGARAENYGKILRNTQFIGEKLHKYAADDYVETEEAEKQLKAFDASVILHLSGTPYRILMGSEFQKEDIVAFCQFSDIVREKDAWDHDHLLDEDKQEWDNPYFGFPQMIRFAFNPNEASQKRLAELKKNGVTFALSALFKPQSIKKTKDGSHQKFIYEAEVLDLLKVIDGSAEDNNILGFLDYPKIKEGKMCRHMVFVLPFCASCDAMEKLLTKHWKEFKNLRCGNGKGDYAILNISGVEQPAAFKTPQAIQEAIKKYEKEDKKTITLTVNRMLTGSTVEQWDTMLFLKDTTSPQEYDQAIFRLQNQYVISGHSGKDSNKIIKINMKPQTLLVDFDPNRMFRMQEAKAQIYNVNIDEAGNSKLQSRLEEELRISPIIAVNAADNKLERITPVDVMNAVSEYSSNRGVIEETLEIPVDASLLENKIVRETIEKENELGSKNGFETKSAEGDGSDMDGTTSQEQPGNSDSQPPEPSAAENGNTDNDDWTSLEKRFRTYYARILYYAFLTKSSVLSIQEILNSLEASAENQRIFENLGLDKIVLGEFLKMDKFVLRNLDYAIQHMNQLANDSNKSPLERAEIANKKFGKIGQSQIVTPAFIADQMVALLPDDFMKNCVSAQRPILDIASKKGEFAIALSKRFEKLGFSVTQYRDLIFSIPTSSICYEFTRKVYEMLGLNIKMLAAKFDSGKLLFVKNKKGDIDYKKICILLNQTKNFDAITLEDDVSKINGEKQKMKFDAVIGNPPYQNGQIYTSDDPIYNYFMDVAFNVSLRSLLITPARFLFNAGKTPKFWNNKVLHDPHLMVRKYFSSSSEIFESVDIKGGIAITERDASQYVGAIGTFIPNDTLRLIVEKIKKTESKFLDDLVFAPESYKLSKKFHKNCPEIDNILSKGHAFDITTNIFDKLGNYFFKNKPQDNKEYIQIAGRYNNQRILLWIRKDYIENHANLDKWKVLVPKANGSGMLGEILSCPQIVAPMIGHTQTFISIGCFATKYEANALLKYIKSKFARVLLGTLKVTQDNKKETWANIPIQNFTEKSDIDWSCSISEIDAQLYKKYGLSAEEIAFVESKIKPME